MKKLLSAVICLSLLLGISAASFAALDEEGFSFQYGNRWGTSIEEVRASIPEEKTAEDVEDIIDWSDETVKGLYVYGADLFRESSMGSLAYCFDDDRLYAAVYHTYDSKNAFDAQVALERLYGKCFISIDKAILLAGILNGAWEDSVYPETLYYILCWELQDGTTILLTSRDQDCILVYYNLDYYTPDIIGDRM